MCRCLNQRRFNESPGDKEKFSGMISTEIEEIGMNKGESLELPAFAFPFTATHISQMKAFLFARVEVRIARLFMCQPLYA